MNLTKGLPELVENVSRQLKCRSNFWGHIQYVSYHGFEGLLVITDPIHEGEARGIGQFIF